MLLRYVQTLGLFEEQDLDQIVRNAFWDKKLGRADLNVSVYDIDDDQPSIVRLHCEHQASWGDPGPRHKVHVNVSGLEPRESVKDDDEDDNPLSAFEYARTRHRILKFLDEDELRTFVGRIKDEHATRRREVIQQHGHDYVINHAGDPEWVALCAGADKRRQKWARWIENQRGARAKAAAKHS